ncbi:beta-lactamase domain-containing protein [Thermaerobacter marianensis DSM 12885]|uniref:beta-lactamase n=1 Tax=Thermaerobacter marianensis (strain ATCC 700841 / DSM 12885 / JCM 10246 / 7p75a) TaxID=644966 RepID=E6SM40_THEM7|nr:MBL fold metallo-hydrolase [Thermaerobacter marianensis]ADU50370.1 beta-lactamase domain-containing protein [Thermaerobacter marianensis DSM 12885]
MEPIRLTARVTMLHGAVNSGLVQTGEGVLVIDTGLDRSAANKILRAVEELGGPVRAVLNTHAHADHFGGNAQIVRKTGVAVYAPAGEAEVIRQPLYEPVYLFGGAAPIAALRHRFLLAEASPVHHEVEPGQRLEWDGVSVEVIDLAGHSLAQVGFLVDGVLFAADSFAGLGPLAKHPIPYLVDAGRMLESLERVREVDAGWFVPGHGPAVRAGAELGEVLEANAAAIRRLLEWAAERLRQGPAGTEDLLAEMGAALGVAMTDPVAYVLNRTALLGVLATLEREGAVRAEVRDGRWWWAAV